LTAFGKNCRLNIQKILDILFRLLKIANNHTPKKKKYLVQAVDFQLNLPLRNPENHMEHNHMDIYKEVICKNETHNT
jgi:hypothetical protein